MRLRALMGFVIVVVLSLPALASASVVDRAETPWGQIAAIVSVLALGALIGTGIVPSGAVGNQLTATTRRAFVPKLVVQLYNATPTLAAGLANAQTASGGVSSVTVPVQGTQLVTAQATDFSGAFNQPAELTGITDAEYNLKCVIVPIPFLGMEGILQ